MENEPLIQLRARGGSPGPTPSPQPIMYCEQSLRWPHGGACSPRPFRVFPSFSRQSPSPHSSKTVLSSLTRSVNTTKPFTVTSDSGSQDFFTSCPLQAWRSKTRRRTRWRLLRRSRVNRAGLGARLLGPAAHTEPFLGQRGVELGRLSMWSQQAPWRWLGCPVGSHGLRAERAQRRGLGLFSTTGHLLPLIPDCFGVLDYVLPP